MIIPPKDINTFKLFIGEATVTFGYILSLSFALKRAVNKVLYCIDSASLQATSSHTQQTTTDSAFCQQTWYDSGQRMILDLG